MLMEHYSANKHQSGMNEKYSCHYCGNTLLQFAFIGIHKKSFHSIGETHLVVMLNHFIQTTQNGHL